MFQNCTKDLVGIPLLQRRYSDDFVVNRAVYLCIMYCRIVYNPYRNWTDNKGWDENMYESPLSKNSYLKGDKKMKKLMLTILIMVGMLIGTGGCVSEPFIRPNITDAQTFNAPYDKVWMATVQTFTELGSQISVLEKESGFLATAQKVWDYGYDDAELQRIAYCPSIFCAIWSHLRINSSVLVTVQGPDQTRVKMTMTIAAYNRNEFGGGGKWYGCYSRGVIQEV